MANYSQYNGSNGQTAVAQRLLDNGSDWITIRSAQNTYVFIQGKVYESGNNKLSYTGRSWIYNTSQNPPTVIYNESDSGTITVSYPSYIYSSLPEYQSLSVQDVYPRYAFFGVLAFMLIFVGFQCIKRRFVL